jgi:hypothetical protein
MAKKGGAYLTHTMRQLLTSMWKSKQVIIELEARFSSFLIHYVFLFLDQKTKSAFGFLENRQKLILPFFIDFLPSQTAYD